MPSRHRPVCCKARPWLPFSRGVIACYCLSQGRVPDSITLASPRSRNGPIWLESRERPSKWFCNVRNRSDGLKTAREWTMMELV